MKRIDMQKQIQKSNIKKMNIQRAFRLYDVRIFDNTKYQFEQLNDEENEQWKKDRKEKKCFKQFYIEMATINNDGDNALIIIDDFNPSFFVKLPDNWNEQNHREFIQILRNKVGEEYRECLVKHEFVYRKIFEGYTGDDLFKFSYLEFNSSKAFYEYYKLFYSATNKNKLVGFEMKNKAKNILFPYEGQIPQILKYFHIHNISPSGWIYVNITKARQLKYKRTYSFKYEYLCSKSDIKPCDESMNNTLPPFKNLAFDIECKSSGGDFPLPKKDYRKLVNNLIDIVNKDANTKISFQSLQKNIKEQKIKKWIKSAFGFGQLNDGIERIYTKQTLSESELDDKITLLFNQTIRKVAEEIGIENKLSIVNYINKQIENNNVKKNSNINNDDLDDDVGDDIGDDIGDDDDDIEDDELNNDNEEDNDSVMENEENELSIDVLETTNDNNVNDAKKLTKKQLQKYENTTFLTILCNQNLSNTEKVNKLNDIFAFLFPEVEGDIVNFIGVSVLKSNQLKPYRYVIVLGDCSKNLPPNIDKIIRVNTERELLLKFTELVIHENPQIMSGYNIFGFDYEFMFQRAKELNCVDEFLKMSIINDEICGKKNYDTDEWDITTQTTKLATGEYNLRYIQTFGRIQLDLLLYMRREHALGSYTLDDVSTEFISDYICNIIPDKTTNTTKIYTENVLGIEEGNYICIQLLSFCSDYYKDENDSKKFRVLSIANEIVIEKKKNKKTGEIEDVNKNYKVIIIQGYHDLSQYSKKQKKWGLAKDDLSPQEMNTIYGTSPENNLIIAKYCIQDCDLVHHLIQKQKVFMYYIEMSFVCIIPISFVILRGQSIKQTSIVAKKCREINYLIADRDKSTSDNSGYEGAIVLEPKRGIYIDKPVACLDYSSLYPSLMMSNNLCRSSKVWTKEYDLEGNLIAETGIKNEQGEFIYDNLPNKKYLNTVANTYRYIRKVGIKRAKKVKVGTKICRWIQYEYGKYAILPSIVQNLLQKRKETRKKAENTTDSTEKQLYDCRQLSYKMTANSTYGGTGCPTSTIYDVDVASSVTTSGQQMILYAKKIVEQLFYDTIIDTSEGQVKTYAEYVYGDTDSIFFTLNLHTLDGIPIVGKKALKLTIEIAQKASKYASGCLKYPMSLTYEKTLDPFVIITKKKYAGMLFEEDENKGKLKIMGLMTKKRDSCAFAREFVGQVLTILVFENNLIGAIQFMNEGLTGLLNGNVPISKLIISKQLKSHYKDPTRIGHKVLADRMGQRDPGNKPKAGDRIKFIHIINQNAKLQGDKIEDPNFIEQNKGKTKIDYGYYIEKQIMKTLVAFFGLIADKLYQHFGKMGCYTSLQNKINEIKIQSNGDLVIYNKLTSKYCENIATQLLFSNFLVKIDLIRNNMKSVNSYFQNITKK